MKYFTESTRAASLATHFSASLMLGAAAFSPFRLKMLEAARLMRSAEALTRVATAILLAASDSTATPEGTGSAAHAVGPRPRKRRARRRKGKGQPEMQVDEGTENSRSGAAAAATMTQGPFSGGLAHPGTQTGPAATDAASRSSPFAPAVPTLFGETVHAKTLIAGSTMVTTTTSVLCPSHSGVRCQLVSLGPMGKWTVEIEDTGEIIDVAPEQLNLPLFQKPFQHAVARAWRAVSGGAPT